MILGLDIATRTGWALSDGRYGALTLPQDHAAACERLYGWLCDLCGKVGPRLAMVEDVVMLSAGHPIKQTRLSGAALAALSIHDVAVRLVPPASLKLWATGKGNSGKAAMIEAARAAGYCGLSNKQADEADAIHLMRMGRADDPTHLKRKQRAA